MSKWSVRSVWKLKPRYSTLLRPKYCARASPLKGEASRHAASVRPQTALAETVIPGPKARIDVGWFGRDHTATAGLPRNVFRAQSGCGRNRDPDGAARRRKDDLLPELLRGESCPHQQRSLAERPRA